MIAVQIKNMDTVVKRFSDMQKRAMSPAPAMAVVTNKAYKHVIQPFEDEQGPTGKWASLKGRCYFADIGKITDAPRRKGKGKILQDQGMLRGSIKPRVLGNVGHVYTNKEYAAIHNFGGNVPERFPHRKKMLRWGSGGKWVFAKSAAAFKMSQRKFLWLSDEFVNRALTMLAKYISEGML